MVISGSKKIIRSVAAAAAFPVLFAFTSSDDFRVLSSQVKERFNGVYNQDAEKVKLRRFEINITDDGFFRYRRVLVTGKQEYFSFSLSRLKDMRYLGSTSSGNVILETRSDDIIVQTYQDPRGNVDSMTTQIKIPVRMVEPEDLHIINSNLLALKDGLLKRN